MPDVNFCCDAPKKKAELRRDRVIAASRKLFIENGFHATGIAQIAKESGVAVGQLYRDFSCKEDIVAAIVNTDCRTFMACESLRTAIENGDQIRTREWIHQFIGTDEDDEDGERLFAEIVAEAGRNARIAAIFNDINDDMRILMLDALAMLAPDDSLADRRVALTDTVLTMSLGLMLHHLIRPRLDVSPLLAALHAIIDCEIDALQAAAQTVPLPA